jgi:UDP:flavonoid glycosyltransferase YjiC (YdhE family)
VSFGTVVWWSFAESAVAALRAIADACAGRERVRVVISLGGAAVDPGLVAALEKPNVRVFAYVDQPRILEQADLFITHHGVNSTHEAIFARVPMISYPFFWDQPALARKCQDLGLALPLTALARGAVRAPDVKAAFARFAASAPTLRSSLDKASAWEKETMAQRGRVMQHITDLIGGG